MNHLMLKQLAFVTEQFHDGPDRAFTDTKLDLDVLAGVQDAVRAVADQFEDVLDLGVEHGSRIIYPKYHQLCLSRHLAAVLSDYFRIDFKHIHSGSRKREFLRLAGHCLAGSQSLSGIIR